MARIFHLYYRTIGETSKNQDVPSSLITLGVLGVKSSDDRTVDFAEICTSARTCSGSRLTLELREYCAICLALDGVSEAIFKQL